MHDLFTIPDQAYMDNAWAWSQWAAASCIERHGEHLWHLILEWPDSEDDDWSAVNLACDYCHTSGYDVWNDYAEYLSVTGTGDTLAKLTPDVILDTDTPPRHNAGRAGRVPVTVTAWQTSYYSYFYGVTEYDFGLTIEANGPVEWEDQ